MTNKKPLTPEQEQDKAIEGMREAAKGIREAKKRFNDKLNKSKKEKK